MASDPRNYKAPFINRQQCWREADKFRLNFLPAGKIPVDVLGIIEFDLGLEIRTLTGLKEEADVDALLLSNWKTIIVDQKQYLDARFYNRLRFSLAHELGHYVLHKATFQTMRRETPDEWIAFVQEMPEEEYGFLEYHANEFAGRLLVPRDELKVEFEKALVVLERAGMARSQLNEDHSSYLCIPIAKAFEVSEDVIERRLSREGLWPLAGPTDGKK